MKKRLQAACRDHPFSILSRQTGAVCFDCFRSKGQVEAETNPVLYQRGVPMVLESVVTWTSHPYEARDVLVEAAAAQSILAADLSSSEKP